MITMLGDNWMPMVSWAGVAQISFGHAFACRSIGSDLLLWGIWGTDYKTFACRILSGQWRPDAYWVSSQTVRSLVFVI